MNETKTPLNAPAPQETGFWADYDQDFEHFKLATLSNQERVRSALNHEPPKRRLLPTGWHLSRMIRK